MVVRRFLRGDMVNLFYFGSGLSLNNFDSGLKRYGVYHRILSRYISGSCSAPHKVDELTTVSRPECLVSRWGLFALASRTPLSNPTQSYSRLIKSPESQGPRITGGSLILMILISESYLWGNPQNLIMRNEPRKPTPEGTIFGTNPSWSELSYSLRCNDKCSGELEILSPSPSPSYRHSSNQRASEETTGKGGGSITDFWARRGLT
ncbi:hypothetical protein HOY80DRAFT_360069 [Tuber brumale]|nr:hypothetical protein HOY80DRAFT_360069 [Tuber brumale]